jgi:hypothetical protein
MGDIHQLPTRQDAAARLLERIVIETIEACPDQRVAARWARLARETTHRYVSPPNPTHPQLNIQRIPDLDAQAREQIHAAAAAWLESYFDDVRAQMMAMHRDLLTAQKRIAELEVLTKDLQSAETESH